MQSATRCSSRSASSCSDSPQRVSGALPGLRRVGAFALLAAPCVFVTGMFGQNAFLTASCAALAVCWADRRPMWAGLCIGLLSAKPQMALLFPFVLVATRAWRTVAWPRSPPPRSPH